MQRGFTLIELMITLAIMATLALVATPMAQVAVQRQKEHELRAALLEIREAIDAYKRAADTGHIKVSLGDSGFPKRLDDLVNGVPDDKSARKQMIYFLRKIPRDPFAEERLDAIDTWAKRAYASPPDAPAEGDDIFDVHSRSTTKGLNGVQLKLW